MNDDFDLGQEPELSASGTEGVHSHLPLALSPEWCFSRGARWTADTGRLGVAGANGEGIASGSCPLHRKLRCTRRTWCFVDPRAAMAECGDAAPGGAESGEGREDEWAELTPEATNARIATIPRQAQSAERVFQAFGIVFAVVRVKSFHTRCHFPAGLDSGHTKSPPHSAPAAWVKSTVPPTPSWAAMWPSK